MAISFVVGVGGTSEGNQSSNTVSLPVSGSIQDDDFILFMVTIAITETGAWTDPAGVTEIAQIASLTGQDARIYLGYKIASSESGSYSFTNANTDRVQGSYIVLRGVDTSNPLDVSFVEADHFNSFGSSWNDAAKPITTSSSGAGAWVVLAQLISHDDITAVSPPTNYTTRHSYFNGTGGDYFHRIHYWATRELASASTTETPGAFGHTENGTGSANSFVSTLAIRAAADSGIVVPMFQGPNFNSFIKAR